MWWHFSQRSELDTLHFRHQAHSRLGRSVVLGCPKDWRARTLTDTLAGGMSPKD